MDIYHFIKSKAVIDHLKKIQHNFTPLESAYVIWQSEAPLKEKHAAWREIIDTMPDGPIPETKSNRDLSLHQYLEELMSCQKSLLEEFYREDGCKYCFCYLETITMEELISCKDFDNFQEALAAAKDEVNFFEGWKADFLYIEKRDQNSSQALRMKTNTQGEELDILCVKDLWEAFDEDRHASADTLEFFHNNHVPIPTPFKEWDLLHTPYYEEDIKFVYSKSEDGDGYRISQDGEFKYDYILENILNWEFQKSPLSGHEKKLLLFSDFMKRKIDFVSFMNLNQVISIEVIATKLTSKFLFSDEEEKRYLS